MVLCTESALVQRYGGSPIDEDLLTTIYDFYGKQLHRRTYLYIALCYGLFICGVGVGGQRKLNEQIRV